MTTLETTPWSELWLNKGLPIVPVAGSAMIEIHGVRGYLMPGDVQFLRAFAAALPRAGVHVELGSWMGLSSILTACSLLENLNFDARIYCIDTWEGSPEHQDLAEVRAGRLFETFLANIRSAQVQHFITPLRGRSTQLAAHFADESVDSVFVDADHSYAGCRADIEAWLPKLKPSGRMAGHDAVPGEGVHRAVYEVAAAHGFGVTLLAPPKGHYVWQFVRQ